MAEIQPGENLQNQNVTAPAENVQAQEKLLKQSEVNDIVGRVKRQAYADGQKDALAQNQPQAPIAPQQPAQAQQPLTPEMIRQIAQESSQQHLQQQVQTMMNNKIAQEFSAKVQAGKDKYPDIENVALNELDLPRNLDIMLLANSVDNVPDVLMDLKNNPQKITELKSLAATHPHLARAQIQRLSQSIKQNEAASQQAKPDEPLSQVAPSTTSSGNGKMSINDYQNQPWLRG